MNTDEKIEKAIKKLEDFRAESEPPYLADFELAWGDGMSLDDITEYAFDAGARWGARVEIMRTIDAQLAILKSTRKDFVTMHALALADAILGGGPNE